MAWPAILCFVFAAMSATTSIHDYRPDPILDAFLWAGMGIYILIASYDTIKRG